MRRTIQEYRLTYHARLEMSRRGVTESEVAQVLAAPEQVHEVRPGRIVFQSRLEWGQPTKTYLLRVFVDVDRQVPEVVTVYRTSRIGRYWKDQSCR